ncbi:hypothetical protein GCM10027404_00110 [Arthrobacter tumbae]|uniref:hypothetical protein n=1 Tax=Arthrobacter tumbae TaxID=163874 RepID=UPI001EF91F69|nr:hypothetical protein [Arthrobacter tumbae]MBM7780545.1 hypothetical protein [Arthrobacter tumbae]
MIKIFRISERRQVSGAVSYDFEWLNGPNDGTYGFTIGSVAPGAAVEPSMSHDQLAQEARAFIQGFYEPGGVGEADFRDHMPAKGCDNGDR